MSFHRNCPDANTRIAETGTLTESHLVQNSSEASFYPAGVKGAEREDPTLQGGDGSGAALRHTIITTWRPASRRSRQTSPTTMTRRPPRDKDPVNVPPYRIELFQKDLVVLDLSELLVPLGVPLEGPVGRRRHNQVDALIIRDGTLSLDPCYFQNFSRNIIFQRLILPGFIDKKRIFQ